MRRTLYILIVEDSVDDQLLIKRAFELAGDSVVLSMTRDGIEAIDYLRGAGQFADREHHPYPCFILTDLKMSPGDGFAVLEHVRKGHASVPVTVFSASQDLDDIKKAYLLGAAGFLVKPQVFHDFCEVIKNLHNFWVQCEPPAIDMTGKQLKTSSRGKLGERFSEAV